MRRRALRRPSAAPFFVPRPDVAEAAERLLERLPRSGARLSDLVERTGWPDLLVLRAALLLREQGRAVYRGGRLVRDGGDA